MQVYNYVTGEWSERAGLGETRQRAAAAAAHLDGFIYVSHGSTDSHTDGASAFLDRYEIATDTWTALSDSLIARDHVGGGIVNGEYCVVGGQNSSGEQTAETECYDIENDTWSTRASLDLPRSSSAVGTLCDGRSMVAGGEDESGVLSEVSVFDGTVWEEFPSLQVARHGTTTVAVDCACGQLYFASGTAEVGRVEEGLDASQTEHFFPQGINESCSDTMDRPTVASTSSPAWEVVAAAADDNFVTQSTACFVMGNDGLAYLIGGYNKSPLCTYDPTLREWACEEVNIPKRVHHSQCVVVEDEIWFPSALGNKITDDDVQVDKIQVYNYGSKEWTSRTGMDGNRLRAGAATAYLDEFL